MEIGDQWNLRESDSPQQPSRESGSLPGSVLQDPEPADAFPSEEPQSGQAVDVREFKDGDFWIEFQDPAGPSVSSKPAPTANQGEAAEDTRLLHWAALLTGNAGLRDGTAEQAQEQLIDWLMQTVPEETSSLSGFPEAFQTIRFWSAVKTIHGPLRLLKTISDNLRSGAMPFAESVERIGRNFSWDEERLFKWEQDLENIAGLRRWIPSFSHAYHYLSAAFPLGIEKLDSLRSVLLQQAEEPHRFLEPSSRNEFDTQFLNYKKNYMDSYFLLHEDVLHVMGVMKKDEAKVDAVALRNLELLSSLQYADQSYLNRVKLLARWIQHNQCNLPLHQILETYPRCYCNFNPISHQQPASSVAQINTIIQEGLEYFRTILRRCGHLILQEAESQPIDDESLRQVTAALSDGPMIPLKAPAIKALNRIIVRNQAEFLAEFRKSAAKTSYQ